jgi:hypothetical protein
VNAKAWFLEVRPQFLLLSVVLAFLGTTVAWYEGFFNLGFALLAFLGWWVYPVSEQFTITASRLLPRHTVAGQPFPVAITVASNSTTPLSLIVRENLPEGAALLSAVPAYSAYEDKAREVKWLRKIDGSQVFAYMVKLKQPEGAAAFTGKVALSRGSDGR